MLSALASIRKKLGHLVVTMTVVTGLIVIALNVTTIQSAQAQQAPEPNEYSRLKLSSFIPGPIEITPYLRWYVDKTRRMVLSDIRGLPDSAFVMTTGIPSFGYSRDAIWYRLDITVQDKLTTKPLIELNPTYLNFIDVMIVADSTRDPVWQDHLGDHIPASERTYAGSTQVAALPLLDTGDYQMFIRVKSNSANFLRAKLWPAGDLISSLTYRNIATNVFFGIIATLGFAYLALGVMARDPIVVLYGIWVASVGGVVAIVNGVVLSDIRPETPWMNDLLLGQLNVISHAATAFLWLHITGIRKRHPLMFKIYCGYSAMILFFLFGATNDLYTVFGTYIIPSHSVFMALMCLHIIRRLFKNVRNKMSWAFLIVLVMPTGPAIMLQLAHVGLIEATPMRLGLHQFTLLFHIIAMSILMGFRLASMDRERISVAMKAAETTTLVEEQRKLISMLSHEFRTPLAVIQRSAEMLMLRLKNHKGDVMDRLQRIQLQARKLARLVDIFLSKDGIDNQELSLAREVVSVDRFMEEFVANTTREGAEIFLTIHHAEGVEAYIDETLIGLAITNLIETSRRFAHGNPLHLVLQRQSKWLVEIAIPCSGPELDDEEIRLIGAALFRKDVESGSQRSALGLHISQRIVDAHGGSIKLRDRGQSGIELCLLLPIKEPAIKTP